MRLYIKNFVKLYKYKKTEEKQCDCKKRIL